MDINTIITTWIASIVTGVIVVVITTGIGKIVSIWWKNRTFLKNRDRGNEKYIDNILPYMIQKNRCGCGFYNKCEKCDFYTI